MKKKGRAPASELCNSIPCKLYTRTEIIKSSVRWAGCSRQNYNLEEVVMLETFEIKNLRLTLKVLPDSWWFPYKRDKFQFQGQLLHSQCQILAHS